jgi:hypothetical protein
MRKAHRKKPTFYVFTPACFETGFGFISGFEDSRNRRKVSRGIFQKNPKNDEVII